MIIFVSWIDKGIYYDNHALQGVVIYHTNTNDNSYNPIHFYKKTTTLIEHKVYRKTGYVTLNTKSANHS